MTSKQAAKLKMYQAVIAHCKASDDLIAMIPAFIDALTDLQQLVVDLRSKARDELEEIKDFAVNKSMHRKQLIQLTLDTAGSIFAYATTINDVLLKEQVNLNYSDLNRLKDELLGPACSNILEIAEINVNALTSYGINHKKISLLQNAITDFIVVMLAPRNAIAKRASIARSIRQLFRNADILLKERMDKLAFQFKSIDPVFYPGYKRNRLLKNAVLAALQANTAIRSGINSD